MKKELRINEVKYNFNFGYIENDNSKSVNIFETEYKKIARALNIDKEGYNLYLIDTFSKEKINELKKYIEDQYKYLEPPKDICYVIYEDSKKPEVLFVKNGNGKKLIKVVEEIKNHYLEIVEDFYNSSSDNRKEDLIDEIQNKRSDYINELIESARIENFEVKFTNKGFAFIPLVDGKIITEKQYDDLSNTRKEEIVVKANKLKKKAEHILLKLKEIEAISMKKLKELYTDYISNQMEVYKDEALLEFIDDDNAYEFLERLFLVIERKIIDCYNIDVDEDEEELYKIIHKNYIHLLVDNSLVLNPPVIYEEDPSVNNLIGFIEYENNNGIYSTDISLINSGSILRANSGCLIIRMNSLVNNYNAYFQLKKALLTSKVNFDVSKSYVELISINSLKPEPIPIKLKVILIGDQETYDILYNLDEDFRRLFPLRAEFKSIIELNKETQEYIITLANKVVKENSLNILSKEALSEVIKYLARRANNRRKINIEEREIEKLILLANDRAKNRKAAMIERKDIIETVYERELIEEEYDKLFKENKILISVKEEKVGVINALAVIDTGYYSFGKPMRITCVAQSGNGRIIDIQKENKLSGKIHEKSVSILKGLLNNLISPYEELPVDFYLSFEQTYGLIDGDSASIAEVICILSALSKRPIKQNIAVTGSVNQLGEVQPIGGVNEKIEGFFRMCKYIDTVQDKGVLIPDLNKDDLILDPEIENAVEKGEFHIYVMNTLEDAIETLILNDGETLEEFYKKIKFEIDRYKRVKEDKLNI
ncbi:AAA family ATPase [Clostridium isatidis]|uniref:endopeptidase La n=1 Tax=Clostridium isatidis TaxID=182773 RepID=A0A343JG42_9CLOT|nr:AAA family ATPase [Clostridium isatidis]ASW44500.1 ATP-dependent protease [Clostridium isatidis]NLZ35147.1 AAA family ATPase [Clostridiales bacterium]